MVTSFVRTTDGRRETPSIYFLTQRQKCKPYFGKFTKYLQAKNGICYVPASIAVVIPRRLSGVSFYCVQQQHETGVDGGGSAYLLSKAILLLKLSFHHFQKPGRKQFKIHILSRPRSTICGPPPERLFVLHPSTAFSSSTKPESTAGGPHIIIFKQENRRWC